MFMRDRTSYEIFKALIVPILDNRLVKKLDKILAYKRHESISSCWYHNRVIYVGEYDDLETYDLELEGSSDIEHCFFADGIFTHNSHSVSYSILAYITAFLKVNYPAEFMCSLISSDNDIEKRSVWINDARETLGLAVKPPDINKSNEDFTACKREIVFGIREVKGIGANVVNSIFRERKKGEFTSLKNFYDRVDLQAVNAGRFAALVQAGAFDTIHENRAELIAWDEIIRDRRTKNLTKRKLRIENIDEMKKSVTMNDDDLLSSFATKPQLKQLAEGRKTRDEVVASLRAKNNQRLLDAIESLKELESEDYFSDLPELPNLTLSQIILAEEELLGIQLSGTLASPFINEIRMYGSATVGDLKDPEYKAYTETFCGVFENIKPVQVKNGVNRGKEMCIADFIDLTGKIRAIIITKTWAKCKGKLMTNKPFIVRGRLSDDKDALICMEINEC